MLNDSEVIYRPPGDFAGRPVGLTRKKTGMQRMKRMGKGNYQTDMRKQDNEGNSVLNDVIVTRRRDLTCQGNCITLL
jgi:hypothetical protein